MGKLRKGYVFKFVLFISLVHLHDTVTVNPNPLCPTNKIAPHRRVQAISGRTFAAYYDLLLGPNSPRPQTQTQNPLQEEPQADQPDDCGEIDDYDENDIGYVNNVRRRNGRTTENRFLFGGLFHRPQKLPAYTPTQPQAPVTSASPVASGVNTYFPQRPPFWSGGYFSQNQYSPPSIQEPSDNLKPVHEAADISEVSQQTYRPGLVGGPLGHVVGLSQARPTPSTPAQDEKTRRRLEYLNNLRLQQRPTQPTYYTTRRPRKLSNDRSVVGSFLDLFFK